MIKLSVEQAKAIVKKISDEAVYSMYQDTEIDLETIALRLLYQIEHPEVIETEHDE